MNIRIGLGVKMNCMERYLLTLTQLLAELLIPIRLCPTQMEITMYSLDSISKTFHRHKKTYGISSAGEGYEIKGTTASPPALPRREGAGRTMIP
jgi:hypothetical protein